MLPLRSTGRFRSSLLEGQVKPFEDALRRRARLQPGPGGAEVWTIAPVDLAAVAREFLLVLRQAELLALEAKVVPERYLRNLGTFGWDGQHRLLEASVAVIGCGGLGGYLVEGLARSGVGRLVVVDADRFAAHNLNRQLLCTLDDLGQPKVEVARRRVERVNPAVEVVAWAVSATAENLPGLLEEAQVVVDALDNPRDRLVLQSAARQRGIPLVHGAVAGPIGQVTTILPGDDTLALLYGTEGVMDHGAEWFLGTPAMGPMLVAACQVAEVLKILLGRGKLLRGRLLYLDLESGTVEQFLLGCSGE